MKRRRKKIGWTFSFAKMHPVLQVTALVLIGTATIGYVLCGTWLAYILLTR